MIYEIETYNRFLKKLTDITPAIKVNLLVKAFMNNFDEIENEDNAKQILRALQEECVIYISEDGWAMTGGVYVSITGDRFLSDIKWHQKCYAGYHASKLEKLYGDVNKCLSFIVSKLPLAGGFGPASFPFSIVYATEETDDEPSYVYEICYVSEAREDSMAYIMPSLPKYSKVEFKKYVRYVAFVDHEAAKDKIPYYGFKYICMADISGGYRIIETRDDDVLWAEYY